MQVPFVKISVKDRAQDILDRFCVKAAVQDPCVRLAVQGVYKRFPQKISVSNLKVRSLLKLSRQHLLPRSLLSSPGLCTTSRLLVVSCTDLCTRSLWGFCWQDPVGGLLARSPNKIYTTGFLARSLCKLPRRSLKLKSQGTRTDQKTQCARENARH